MSLTQPQRSKPAWTNKSNVWLSNIFSKMSCTKVSQVQKEALSYPFWQMRTPKCQDLLLEYQMLVLGKFSIWHMFRSTSGLRFVGQIPLGHYDLFQSPGSGLVSSTNPTPQEWRPKWWEAIVYSELPRGMRIAMVQVWFSVFLRWKEQHIFSSEKSDSQVSHLISCHDRPLALKYPYKKELCPNSGWLC